MVKIAKLLRLIASWFDGEKHNRIYVRDLMLSVRGDPYSEHICVCLRGDPLETWQAVWKLNA